MTNRKFKKFSAFSCHPFASGIVVKHLIFPCPDISATGNWKNRMSIFNFMLASHFHCLFKLKLPNVGHALCYDSLFLASDIDNQFYGYIAAFVFI